MPARSWRNLFRTGLGLCLMIGGAVVLQAQPSSSNTVRSQSTSSLSYGKKNGEETVEITNVTFEVTGDSVPGRPRNSRLALRTTTHSTQIVGDKGIESTVTMEAWPLGADLQRKALYTVSVPAVAAQTLDGALWIVDRATDPDVSWWSVYKLGTGQHLFDTYTDLLKFSISREELKQRYAGIEVPPDDVADSRLKAPNVIAVVTYASAERVMREALITCDRKEQAVALRSYADSTRILSLAEQPGQQAIRILFTANYPSQPNPVTITIPIVKDDLDLAHASLPAGFHVSP
jgi:hypothetical protein